jgi:ferredoxin-type protein NapH
MHAPDPQQIGFLRRIGPRRLRTYSVVAVIVLAASGAFTHFGLGTLSSFGYGELSAICPLGFLEVAVAGRTLVPHVLVGILVTVLLTVVFGRAFCAWVCPVPLVTPFRKARRAAPDDGLSAGTRYYVLGGTLLSSAIFGFPVFCLICPVGLLFGTLFAVMRLFRFNEPTITLLVFPAILILELVVLGKWCSKICPLGALISLISAFNRTLRPQVDAKACLLARGESCRTCQKVCPEGLDLHEPPSALTRGLCTKCGDCQQACPGRAIRFPWRERIPG